jgi:hypothetical protein
MSKVTRRQVIRAGVAAGAALGAGTANAGPEKEKPSSFVDPFLPAQLTKEEIQASKNTKFTKLEFAGSTFWVGIVDWLGDGVPHTLIGIYAPHKDGGFRLSLFAESWAAFKIEASVDKETGVLELRERANSELKGQLVLACNLRTVGTQNSIPEK